MVYSTYTQQQILYFYRKTKPKFYLCLSHLLLQLTLPLDIAKGFKSTTIVELLRKEGVNVKVCTVCQLLKKYRETGSIAHRPGTYNVTVFTVTYLSSPRSGFLFSGSLFSLFHPSLVAECCFFNFFYIGLGRPTKITPNVLRIVEMQMQADDETTAVQLQKVLVDKGHPLALKTILVSREKRGWPFRGSAYCQITSHENKQKRLNWETEHKDEVLSNQLEDVLWTDECSVMLECHKRFCWRKKGAASKPKPRAKQLCKVHIWAGIAVAEKLLQSSSMER